VLSAKKRTNIQTQPLSKYDVKYNSNDANKYHSSSEESKYEESMYRAKQMSNPTPTLTSKTNPRTEHTHHNNDLNNQNGRYKFDRINSSMNDHNGAIDRDPVSPISPSPSQQSQFTHSQSNLSHLNFSTFTPFTRTPQVPLDGVRGRGSPSDGVRVPEYGVRGRGSPFDGVRGHGTSDYGVRGKSTIPQASGKDSYRASHTNSTIEENNNESYKNMNKHVYSLEAIRNNIEKDKLRTISYSSSGSTYSADKGVTNSNPSRFTEIGFDLQLLSKKLDALDDSKIENSKNNNINRNNHHKKNDYRR
jgi:hypothetical protein